MTTAQPDLDFAAMMADPFPYFAGLRSNQRWTWSETMRMWLVSRFDDVVYVDSHPEIFSTEIPGALLTRTIGQTMIRSEGERHRRVRSAGDEPLKRRSIQRAWPEVIRELAQHYIEPLRDRDQADLAADFANDYTGACLREVLGLLDATPEDIRNWSDAYIQGFINNNDDPQVWATAERARAENTEAVRLAVERVRKQPDATVVSAMAHAHPENPLSLEEIAANIRLMIAGGFNDARDAVATLPWLLMTHPEIRQRTREDSAAFERAIDESVRWLTPVGSYPRVVIQDYSGPAADLKVGDTVLVLAASANYDERKFADPSTFDIDRPGLEDHLGFSVGAHFCLGSHLVRAMMRAAVPLILDLPGIRPAGTPQFVGWQFRGPVTVPVLFDHTEKK
ncbi:cytochrome P450 [Nocardia sp. R6R-6]|uniref:cytochrome P450 n=1 Tax=Nocardia sp. R6R-6 TaxID=3459303 RepID=UPI00403E0B93